MRHIRTNNLLIVQKWNNYLFMVLDICDNLLKSSFYSATRHRGKGKKSYINLVICQYYLYIV